MKVGYLNFDEYIRQGDPSQREKAGYWQTAFLHIHSTAEWCVQPNLTDSIQVPHKYPNKYRIYCTPIIH